MSNLKNGQSSADRIEWEALRLSHTHEKSRKSNVRAKPIEVELTGKLPVLRQLLNLSNERMGYQMQDRLKGLRLLEVLSVDFRTQPSAHAYLTRAGP